MKIVVLNDSFLKESHIERLRALGELEMFEKSDNEDLIIKRLAQADVAISDMYEAPLNNKVFSNIPSVKFMSINSTGFDLVDTQSAKEHGVIVSNVPGFGTEGVAEHAIALMLATVRHIPLGDQAMRAAPFQLDPANRDHDRYLGTTLYGKTIGIIGLGQIGTRLAEIANAMGMKVLGCSRSTKQLPNIEIVRLEDLLKRSDFVSLNGALTDEQEKLINEEALVLMKPSSILINTARGGFIDDIALADALSKKQIAGAGLDFLNDWSTNNPLTKLDNVVLTPHVGWFTEESLENMADIITGNVEAFASRKPVNVINN